MNKVFKSTSARPVNLWKPASWLLLLSIAVLILTTAVDYGESWDEDIRYREGERKLEYYQHLLSRDFQKATEIGSRRDKYPGFHDLTLAILRRVSPLSDRLTGNLFSGLFGFLTLLGAWMLVRKITNDRTAFFSLLLLATFPAFYGHMFINPKDIPFACGYVWSIYMILAWLKKASAPAWRDVFLTGIAFGVTMATRVGGLLVICYLLLFVSLLQLYNIYRKTGPHADGLNVKNLMDLAGRVAVAVFVGMLILLLYWPYGQLAPFARTGATFEAISAFDWQMPVFFEGQFYKAPDLPFYYILKMFLIKTPVLTLLMLVIGMCLAGAELLDYLKNGTGKSLKLPLLAFSVLFPIAFVIARDSVLYNGLRHLLFIVPPLCCLAAIGLDKSWQFLDQSHRRLLVPFWVVALSVMLLAVMNMVRLHPYQYIYYNELAGGTATASQRYETDYWCTVYKELGEIFVDYLYATRPTFTRPEIIVNMEHVTWLLEPFIPKTTPLPIHVNRSSPENDDYYISSTSWMADRFYAGLPVATVQRGGVKLGVIKDRRNLNATERTLTE